MAAVQLELFPDSSVTLRTIDRDHSSFGQWSFSRREVFERCQRLYYYFYYGSATRLATAQPEKESLRFLKTLSSRYLRAGDILHRVIRLALKASERGDPWPSAAVLDRARRMFEADRTFSRNWSEGSHVPMGDNSPVLLMEYYYRFPRAEQICNEVAERMYLALTSFCRAEEFRPFRDAVLGGGAKIEHPLSAKIAGITVRGKVDLSFKRDGHVAIVDWKMGEEGTADDSLQLMLYALWAMDTFGCPATQIQLFKAHLGPGTVSRFSFTEESVARARARIMQDVERMQSVDEYGRKGIAAAFTPCDQEGICGNCVFQGVCRRR